MSPTPTLPFGVVSLDDYERLARERLEAGAWAYISGGAADERTIAWNREAFDRVRLLPRVLEDLSGAHTRTALPGAPALDFPILLAPLALQKLAHPEGERETARAADALQAVMVVSTEASCTIEEIAALTRAPLWFQLYVQHDRGFTRELVQRAAAAGCAAVMLTVDAPVSGPRNRQQRAAFSMPDGIECVHLRDLPVRREARPGLVESPLFGTHALEAAATWRDIDWLRQQTQLPLYLKGIASPADAMRAVEAGVQGLVVSNHGGRTLDTVPASIDLLPAVAARVGRRVPVLLDGGIRRGTDVLKAIALGASAVMIGRPYAYGLAVAGGIGVAHVVHLLRSELEAAMALTGCPTPADITPDVIWRGQPHD